MENNNVYKSKIGETRTYDEWRQEAVKFYVGLQEEGYTKLPENWFDRLTRVLKLEVVVEVLS